MIPKTAKAARASGAPRYNTGKPCRNGHKADRRTSTRACILCRKEILKRSDKRRQAQRRSASALRRSNHRHSWGFASHFWTENAEYYRWAAIISILSGLDLEIDHIVPLNHPDVCGLHYYGNFRLISGDANRKKSNRFPDEERHPQSIRKSPRFPVLPG